MSTDIQFNHVGPQFAVKDVKASVQYYQNILGFEIDYENGSPVSYAVVFKDEVYIHLCLQGIQEFRMGPGCCFIVVSNIENLWEKINNSQAEILQPLQENDYGQGVFFKDLIIKDLDDNVLRIGQPIDEVS